MEMYRGTRCRGNVPCDSGRKRFFSIGVANCDGGIRMGESVQCNMNERRFNERM